PTTGVMYVTVSEIRLELDPVQTAPKGTHVSIPVPDKVRPSDKLFLLEKVKREE
ncbi:MAG: U32 family peptidase, partial [Prevotella sp.]|nr:U32 family peptidase [Prevotella sp.]